MYKIKLTF